MIVYIQWFLYTEVSFGQEKQASIKNIKKQVR